MNKGQFKKGNKPWNKGLKGIHLHPKTEFKKGKFVGPKHPSWKGGITVNSNDCVLVWSGAGKRKRRPKAIYEKYKGKIPKNYVIYHLDGNKHNDDINNLVAISRKELLKINQNKKVIRR